MPRNSPPNFSQLVCSAAPVQGAFTLHRPTRVWWRLILWLHGKPISASLSPGAQTRRIADGFTFYAGLYRMLSILFLLLGPALFWFDAAGSPAASGYWAGASALAGCYLWSVSGLGYAGARAYAANQPQGTAALVTFLVMIVAFLSLFVAAVSLVAQHAAWLSPASNLIAAATLFTFGIGSYLIEILYLTTEYRS